MDRRRLLTLVAAGLAGCTDSTPPEDSPSTAASSTPSSSSTRTQAPPESPTDTEAETATPPREDLPEVRESRFEGASCPVSDEMPYPSCYHAHERGTPEAVYLVPDGEQLGYEGTTTFTLANGTSQTVVIDYDWSLYKHVESWHKVRPVRVGHPAVTTVEPGQTATYHFGVNDANVGANGREATMAPLGGGRYAFDVNGYVDAPENSLHATALFDLKGDRLELEPDDVDRTERNDDSLVVYTGAWEQEEESSDSRRTVLLEQTSGFNPTPLIAEQLIRTYTFRNGLPFLRQADRVGIKTARRGAEFLHGITETENGPFQYRDLTFTASDRSEGE